MGLPRQPLNRVSPFSFPDGAIGVSQLDLDAAIYGQDFHNHSNCRVSNLQNGDVMSFDLSSQKWVNSQLMTVPVDGGTF